MTKKLEELLNLPESKDIAKKSASASRAEIEEARSKMPADNFFRDIEEIDKIATALPSVKGLGDASDSEFDALAQRATDAYDDLMDLGMNVDQDSRPSGDDNMVAGEGMLITDRNSLLEKLKQMK